MTEERGWQLEIHKSRMIQADKSFCAGGDILFLVTKRQPRSSSQNLPAQGPPPADQDGGCCWKEGPLCQV